jgi:hypothetical protein
LCNALLWQDFWNASHSYDEVTDASGGFPIDGLKRDHLIEDYANDCAKLKQEKGIETRGLVYVQVYHTERETGDNVIFVLSIDINEITLD